LKERALKKFMILKIINELKCLKTKLVSFSTNSIDLKNFKVYMYNILQTLAQAFGQRT
jgi:hypothetical protein